MVLTKRKPPLLKRVFRLSVVTPYAYITIIFTFLVCGNLNAQQLRKWTNTEGKSFSGTIVRRDVVVAQKNWAECGGSRPILFLLFYDVI